MISNFFKIKKIYGKNLLKEISTQEHDVSASSCRIVLQLTYHELNSLNHLEQQNKHVH